MSNLHGYINYLNKHADYPAQISTPAATDLRLIIVIPCYNEPKLIQTLKALWQCKRPNFASEVIIVINHTQTTDKLIQQQNQSTLQQCRYWIQQHQDSKLQFFPLYFPDLPLKFAGVGLARKIGMDEAIYRFLSISQSQGIIASLDADCICDSNYLTSITAQWQQQAKTAGITIPFQHILPQPQQQRHYLGMIYYELYLHYYQLALATTGYPYAYHSIGSCFSVAANTYVQQGGMNKRQAGEDFYFLAKITLLPHFYAIKTTTVYPSSRVSNRTPFGTGPALQQWLNSQQNDYLVYHPSIFTELRLLFQQLPQLYQQQSLPLLQKLSPQLQAFLSQQQFQNKIMEIKQHTASFRTFKQRFFRYFNGLLILKWLHFAQNYYTDIPVIDALQMLGLPKLAPYQLLLYLQQQQKRTKS